MSSLEVATLFSYMPKRSREDAYRTTTNTDFPGEQHSEFETPSKNGLTGKVQHGLDGSFTKPIQHCQYKYHGMPGRSSVDTSNVHKCLDWGAGCSYPPPSCPMVHPDRLKAPPVFVPLLASKPRQLLDTFSDKPRVEAREEPFKFVPFQRN